MTLGSRVKCLCTNHIYGDTSQLYSLPLSTSPATVAESKVRCLGSFICGRYGLTLSLAFSSSVNNLADAKAWPAQRRFMKQQAKIPMRAFTRIYHEGGHQEGSS